LFNECRYNGYGLVVPDFGQSDKAGMTFHERDDTGVFEPWSMSLSQWQGIALFATSGGLALMSIASGIEGNPFPPSDDVLDLRITFPLLRHCCSSLLMFPGFVQKAFYNRFV